MRRLPWFLMCLVAWWMTMVFFVGGLTAFGIAFTVFFGSLIGVPVIAYIALAEWLASVVYPSRRWTLFTSLTGVGLVLLAAFAVTRPNWRWPQVPAEWGLALSV